MTMLPGSGKSYIGMQVLANMQTYPDKTLLSAGEAAKQNNITLLPDLPILSIRQPWPWLIMNAGKDIENRSWATKVRGRVLIHAAKGIGKAEWQDAWDWVKHQCPEAWEKGCREIKPGTIERGGIVGSVEIVDCVTQSDSPWYAAGQYGFVLRDPQPLPFYPCKGKLGFFRL